MPHRSLEAGRIATAKHYSENKEYYRARNKRRVEEFREIAKAAKNVPCADCQQSYPTWVMQFDHLRDKEYTIAALARFPSKERLLAEIAKCEVVCANCHAERTHQRRVDKQQDNVLD